MPNAHLIFLGNSPLKCHLYLPILASSISTGPGSTKYGSIRVFMQNVYARLNNENYACSECPPQLISPAILGVAFFTHIASEKSNNSRLMVFKGVLYVTLLASKHTGHTQMQPMNSRLVLIRRILVLQKEHQRLQWRRPCLAQLQMMSIGAFLILESIKARRQTKSTTSCLDYTSGFKNQNYLRLMYVSLETQLYF